MPLEDFTAYTEVDPNNHMSKTATHIDFTAYRNEDCYLYSDKGANHFGTAWEHRINVKAVSHSSNGLAVCHGLANHVGDLVPFTNNEVGVFVYYSSGAGSNRIYLFEHYNGAEYVQAYSIAEGIWYYLTITKNGTSLQCKIYSDAARTNLLTTLSLTLHADVSYQYIYASQTQNDGYSYSLDVDIENLDLQEGAVLKEVTDYLGLTDGLLRDRIFAVADFVGVGDVPLKGWVPLISDSVALSDAVLRDKTLTVTDLVGLSEIVEVVAGAVVKYVADVVGLAELVFLHKPSVEISDALVA